MRKLAVLALGFVLVLASVPVLKAAATGYHILNEIKIGGEGGWDYLTVDSAAQRLYVSHATHVVVVDLATGKVVGDIPDTPGVHGIALAPKLSKGFISNGRGNNVTMFDMKTLKATGTIPTEMNPDDITFEPFDVDGAALFHLPSTYPFTSESSNSLFSILRSKVESTFPIRTRSDEYKVDRKIRAA